MERGKHTARARLDKIQLKPDEPVNDSDITSAEATVAASGTAQMRDCVKRPMPEGETFSKKMRTSSMSATSDTDG